MLDVLCLYRCGEQSYLVTSLVIDKRGFNCPVAQIVFVGPVTTFDVNMMLPEFKIK